jgi:hypothetical protein
VRPTWARRRLDDAEAVLVPHFRGEASQWTISCHRVDSLAMPRCNKTGVARSPRVTIKRGFGVPSDAPFSSTCPITAPLGQRPRPVSLRLPSPNSKHRKAVAYEVYRTAVGGRNSHLSLVLACAFDARLTTPAILVTSNPAVTPWRSLSPLQTTEAASEHAIGPVSPTWPSVAFDGAMRA